jgi:hypothetical protein
MICVASRFKQPPVLPMTRFAGARRKKLKGTVTAEFDLYSTIVVRANGLNHQAFSYVYARSSIRVVAAE